MAFLFKSKKNADKAQGKDVPNGVAGSQSSLQSSNGRINEKQSTPGSSVNNSMNSLQGGAQTPSPEQLNGRRGPSTEQQPSDLPVSYQFSKIDLRDPQNTLMYKILTPFRSFGTVLRQQFNR
jgi:hypothetical protein